MECEPSRCALRPPVGDAGNPLAVSKSGSGRHGTGRPPCAARIRVRSSAPHRHASADASSTASHWPASSGRAISGSAKRGCGTAADPRGRAHSEQNLAEGEASVPQLGHGARQRCRAFLAELRLWAILLVASRTAHASPPREWAEPSPWVARSQCMEQGQSGREQLASSAGPPLSWQPIWPRPRSQASPCRPTLLKAIPKGVRP
jgi:hypothetical protein